LRQAYDYWQNQPGSFDRRTSIAMIGTRLAL